MAGPRDSWSGVDRGRREHRGAADLPALARVPATRGRMSCRWPRLGPDAIDCVTDRMAAAGLVRRRGDSGKFEPRHKADARIDRSAAESGWGLNESTQSPLVSAEVDLRDFHSCRSMSCACETAG